MERTKVVTNQLIVILVLRIFTGLRISTAQFDDDWAGPEMSTEEVNRGQAPQPVNDKNTGKVGGISPEDQRKILDLLEVECFSKASVAIVKLEATPDIVLSTEEVVGDAHAQQRCEKVWDGIACWPETPAGQMAVLPCPKYFQNFDLDGFATRQCESDGRWYFNSAYNRSWTNYSNCVTIEMEDSKTEPFPADLKIHLARIRLIYYIGYSTSLIVLLIAVTTMLSLRKLRCPRNLLHINLFFSFILRALLALSRDVLMSEGFAMSGDVIHHDNGTSDFDENDSHWECRLLMAAFNFAMVANNTWIFIEGLYLHTLLFVTIFSESSSVLPYVVFGWTLPSIVTTVWSFVRLTLDNVFCWNTHTTPGYFWIIRGPGLAMVIVNFGFFLNVIRVLFTKLRAFNSPDSRRYRHRKLVKSALVLIPLFGVPYICFCLTPDNSGHLTELAKLYFEMTFNSFNGVIVAILYCFFNGESEIRKKWQRYRAVNNVCERSRRTTLTSNLYPTRYGHHQSLRSGCNSSIGLDHDDQLGTVYEVTLTTKSGGGGAAATDGGKHRRGSSGSWMSESSAIQMKTMDNGRAGKRGEANTNLHGSALPSDDDDRSLTPDREHWIQKTSNKSRRSPTIVIGDDRN